MSVTPESSTAPGPCAVGWEHSSLIDHMGSFKLLVRAASRNRCALLLATDSGVSLLEARCSTKDYTDSRNAIRAIMDRLRALERAADYELISVDDGDGLRTLVFSNGYGERRVTLPMVVRWSVRRRLWKEADTLRAALPFS
jgi:hypothetical protein